MNKIESQHATEDMSGEVHEIAEIKTAIGDKLEEFFSVIKSKFNDPEAGWTPARLEANSTERLAPIISSLRDMLQDGGSADADGILQELVDVAIMHAQSGGSKEGFVEKVTDMSGITPGSRFAKFNEFIGAALTR